MPASLPDLRMPLLGLSAWAGGLLGRWLPWEVGCRLVRCLALRRRWSCVRRRLVGRVLTCLGVLLVFAAVLAGALLRQEQVAANPVAALAGERRGGDARHQGRLRPAGGGRPVRRPGAAPRPGAPGHRTRALPTSWPRRCSCSPTTTGWTPGWAARCARPPCCRRPTSRGWRRSSPPGAVPSCWRAPTRGGAGRRRCGARSGRRSPTAHRASGRSSRRWSTATTRASTPASPTTSGPPGSPTCWPSPAPT